MDSGKLDFWIRSNLNVLMIGKHGVGKTSMVIEAFNKHKLKWLYFSAATMDPWVDFIGVTKEKSNGDGQSYLELVRPKVFQNDEVECIFMDEYNRCITGDTKIQLTGRYSIPISELVGRDYFYVYSYNKQTKKICIGKGHSARLTQKNAKIIKVTLDNGTIIKCTEDHPFLLLDGSYKNAKDLTINDRLMSLDFYSWFVIKIEDYGTSDVYDTTVDDYHNFALECGVFVHNSHKKVRNAVMELIQFKSINGKKFNNLRFIWAAVNPDDENEEEIRYDVEKIDPAQLDRFHVHVEIPYKPDIKFFDSKYGDIAKPAIEWWNLLNPEEKNLVSPRRLDYALSIYQLQGDLRDVLPKNINVSELYKLLGSGPIKKTMEDLFRTKDSVKAKDWINNYSNYSLAIEFIKKSKPLISFYLPLMLSENVSSLMSKEKKIYEYVMTNIDSFKPILSDIVKANTNKKMCNKIKSDIINANITKNIFSNTQVNYSKIPIPKVNKNPNFNIYIQPQYQTLANTSYRIHYVYGIHKNMNLDVKSFDYDKLITHLGECIYHSQSSTLKKIGTKVIECFNYMSIFFIRNNMPVEYQKIRSIVTKRMDKLDVILKEYNNTIIENEIRKLYGATPGKISNANEELGEKESNNLVESILSPIQPELPKNIEEKKMLDCIDTKPVTIDFDPPKPSNILSPIGSVKSIIENLKELVISNDNIQR